jgi:hypothetical protein
MRLCYDSIAIQQLPSRSCGPTLGSHPSRRKGLSRGVADLEPAAWNPLSGAPPVLAALALVRRSTKAAYARCRRQCASIQLR